MDGENWVPERSEVFVRFMRGRSLLEGYYLFPTLGEVLGVDGLVVCFHMNKVVDKLLEARLKAIESLESAVFAVQMVCSHPVESVVVQRGSDSVGPIKHLRVCGECGLSEWAAPNAFGPCGPHEKTYSTIQPGLPDSAFLEMDYKNRPRVVTQVNARLEWTFLR